MAEAIVGLVASLVALEAAAESAWKISKKMIRLARKLRAAKKEIKEFASEIKTFSLVIGAARFTLHCHCNGNSSRSDVLTHIGNEQIFELLVEQFDLIMDNIEGLWPRLESLESNLSFITRLKWLTRQKYVEALTPKMNSVKTSLELVVSLVAYDELMQQRVSKSDDKIQSNAARHEM